MLIATELSRMVTYHPKRLLPITSNFICNVTSQDHVIEGSYIQSCVLVRSHYKLNMSYLHVHQTNVHQT